MDEVDSLAVDLGRVLIEAVEFGFDASPIEAGGPVVDELFEIGTVGTQLPRRVAHLFGPTGPAQPAPQVVEHALGHVDHERLHRKVGHDPAH